jgi:hypothetical protein
VTFVGRLATYRYYNMDQIVGQALATFRRWRRSRKTASRPSEGRKELAARAVAGLWRGTARARAMSRATSPTRRVITKSQSTFATSTCRCPSLGQGRPGGRRWFAALARDERPEVILTSPYVRARQTAKAICEAGALAGGPAPGRSSTSGFASASSACSTG